MIKRRKMSKLILSNQTTPTTPTTGKTALYVDTSTKRLCLVDDTGAVASYGNASTTEQGIVELAIASEVDTGTSVSLAITPDSLAGSNFGERVVQVCLNGASALTTSDLAKFRVPSLMDGMNLVGVVANVGLNDSSGASSSGGVEFSVQNGTTNMLSTNITIDVSEYDTSTDAHQAVINTAADHVATGNIINVEVVAAGTGVTYAIVTLVFRLP
jgi:hypothetical protein